MAVRELRPDISLSCWRPVNCGPVIFDHYSAASEIRSVTATQPVTVFVKTSGTQYSVYLSGGANYRI